MCLTETNNFITVSEYSHFMIIRQSIHYTSTISTYTAYKYKGWHESIQPFWISRELVPWPWCNLAASHRRPYCASVNSHSPVGLVSRQWDAVNWAFVLCDSRIHKISSLSTAILALGKARRRREPNLGCRGADRPEWCDALPKKEPAREL